MELKECFEIFIVQDDWANINRYIGDLVDRNPKMVEVDEFFMAFREVVIENSITPDILMDNLDEKANEALVGFTHWKMARMARANPLSALIMALVGGMDGKHAIDFNGKCQVCPDKNICDLYADELKRRASSQTAQTSNVIIQ